MTFAELEAQLSNPRFIEVHRLSPFPQRSMDIGVVLDVMIHDLEILLHLVKSPLEKVEAVGVPVLTHRRARSASAGTALRVVATSTWGRVPSLALGAR